VKGIQNFLLISKHQEHENEHQLKPSQQKVELDVGQVVVMLLLNMLMTEKLRKKLSQQLAKMIKWDQKLARMTRSSHVNSSGHKRRLSAVICGHACCNPSIAVLNQKPLHQAFGAMRCCLRHIHLRRIISSLSPFSWFQLWKQISSNIPQTSPLSRK
jgi:hypothetical protein